MRVRFDVLTGSRTQDVVEVESTMPESTCIDLRRRGLQLVSSNWAIGCAQSVWVNWDLGSLVGASDHRKDGCALGN
jgi:gamma-glutamyltranspeptidase / glutathione hydrolase